MNKICISLRVPLALLLAVLVPSCASIVSKSNWPVAVVSNRAGVQFEIRNTKGLVVHNGTTPQTVSLDSGAGYFKGAKYTINCLRNGKIIGTTQLNAKVNGWYFGNFLFGLSSVVGLLIVDPLTGAMYSLPKTINVTDEATVTASTTAKAAPSLQIATIDSLTPLQRQQLVRL